MSRKLHAKQRRAAALLASGMQQREIAGRLNMREETLSRWKKIPEFKQEYDRLMDIMAEEMRQQLLSMGALAMQSVNEALRTRDQGGQTAINVLKLFGIGQLLRPTALLSSRFVNESSSVMPETLSEP
jgi:DNA-binding transcriptional regulator LsrR (DeoR family)